MALFVLKGKVLGVHQVKGKASVFIQAFATLDCDKVRIEKPEGGNGLQAGDAVNVVLSTDEMWHLGGPKE